MVPEWFKKQPVYGNLRKAAAVLEEDLLRLEYGLLTQQGRKEELLTRSKTVPRSNGTRLYTALPFRVGMVADPFLFRNYAPTCDLVYLTPDNWLEQLGALDCVIVASVWHGLHGEWTGASLPASAIGKRLLELMEQTRRRGVPVIFYSKEDPANFRWFCRYAEQADRIYTSARECIGDYQSLVPGAGVETLHFAISPRLHNPIGMQPLDRLGDTAFFAGSWTKKYPKRVESQLDLFRWIRRAGLRLEIADRNYSRYRIQYRYPIRYLSSVVPDFPYEEIAALYKLYGWVLNLNSATRSLDMFSLRVYDALACGCLVLSNESPGMERIFPQAYVIDCYERLEEVLHTPRPDLEQRRLAGIRQAFRTGTVYERMERILKSVGLDAACVRAPAVGVIPAPEGAEGLRAMFEAQTYPHKVWISSPHDREAIHRCGMVALWGKGRTYGPTYLEDMVGGFRYTACDYITKPDPAQGWGHRYTDRIEDPYGTLFWREAWEAQPEVSCGPRPNGYVSDGAGYTIDGKAI